MLRIMNRLAEKERTLASLEVRDRSKSGSIVAVASNRSIRSSISMTQPLR
jgi:hypothetical protein